MENICQQGKAHMTVLHTLLFVNGRKTVYYMKVCSMNEETLVKVTLGERKTRNLQTDNNYVPGIVIIYNIKNIKLFLLYGDNGKSSCQHNAEYTMNEYGKIISYLCCCNIISIKVANRIMGSQG